MSAPLDVLKSTVQAQQQQIDILYRRTDQLEALLSGLGQKFGLGDLSDVLSPLPEAATPPAFCSARDSDHGAAGPRNSWGSSSDSAAASYNQAGPTAHSPARFGGHSLTADAASAKARATTSAVASNACSGAGRWSFNRRHDLDQSPDQQPAKVRGAAVRHDAIIVGPKGYGVSHGQNQDGGPGLDIDAKPGWNPAAQIEDCRADSTTRYAASTKSAASTAVAFQLPARPPMASVLPRRIAADLDQLTPRLTLMPPGNTMAGRAAAAAPATAATQFSAYMPPLGGGRGSYEDDGGPEMTPAGGSDAGDHGGQEVFPELGGDRVLMQVLAAAGPDTRFWACRLAERSAAAAAGVGGLGAAKGGGVSRWRCTSYSDGVFSTPTSAPQLPEAVTQAGLSAGAQAALVLMLQCWNDRAAAQAAVASCPDCMRAAGEMLRSGTTLERRIAAHLLWFASRCLEGVVALLATSTTPPPPLTIPTTTPTTICTPSSTPLAAAAAAEPPQAPPGLVGPLVATTRCSDTHAARAAALALHNVLVAEGGAAAIEAYGGHSFVTALLHMLETGGGNSGDSDDDLREEAAAATLGAAAESSAVLRAVVIEERGVEALCRRLSAGGQLVQRSASGALEHLTLEADGAAQLTACGGVQQLMALARHGVGAARVRALSVLRNVADVAGCHAALLQAGVVPLLADIVAAPPPVFVSPVVVAAAAAAACVNRSCSRSRSGQDEQRMSGGCDDSGGRGGNAGGGSSLGSQGEEQQEVDKEAEEEGEEDDVAVFGGFLGAAGGLLVGEEGELSTYDKEDEDADKENRWQMTPGREVRWEVQAKEEEGGEDGGISGLCGVDSFGGGGGEQLKETEEEEEEEEEEAEEAPAMTEARELRTLSVDALVNLATRGSAEVLRALAAPADGGLRGGGSSGGGLMALLLVAGRGLEWDAETVAWALEGVAALSAEASLRGVILRLGGARVLHQLLRCGSPKQRETAALILADLTSSAPKAAKVAMVKGGVAWDLAALVSAPQGLACADARRAACRVLRNLAACPACRLPLLHAGAAEALIAAANNDDDAGVVAAAARALYDISYGIDACRELATRGTVTPGLGAALQRLDPYALPLGLSPFGYGRAAALCGGDGGYDVAIASDFGVGSGLRSDDAVGAGAHAAKLLVKVLMRVDLYGKGKGRARNDVQAALARASIL